MGERTSEEWGRIAVGLPGWRWMPGMLGRAGSLGQLTVRLRCGDEGHVAPDVWPDPDDPATAGCLLALLGGAVVLYGPRGLDEPDTLWEVGVRLPSGRVVRGRGPSIGRACIAAAKAMGRWPGPA